MKSINKAAQETHKTDKYKFYCFNLQGVPEKNAFFNFDIKKKDFSHFNDRRNTKKLRFQQQFYLYFFFQKSFMFSNVLVGQNFQEEV